MAHHGYKWWALPLAFAAVCTGFGLIPFIWLGNRTYPVCPNCNSTDHVSARGNLWPTSYEIWKKAHAADARRFKNNQWILLAVTLVILAAAVAFFYRVTRK